MKATRITRELATRAAEVLKAVLHQVSTIKVKEIEMKAADAEREMDILARIDVLGHNHTLACKLASSSEPGLVRKALQELRDDAKQLPEGATPVFIAPYLPPEAREICTTSEAGFLDLEENARLMVGEVFISKRSLPRRKEQTSPSAPQAAGALRKFPPARAAAPAGACGAQALGCA